MAEVKASFVADANFKDIVKEATAAAAALQALKKSSNDMSAGFSADAKRTEDTTGDLSKALSDLSHAQVVVDKSTKSLNATMGEQSLVTKKMLEDDDKLLTAYSSRSRAISQLEAAQKKYLTVLNDENSTTSDLEKAVNRLQGAQVNLTRSVSDSDTVYRKHLGTLKEYHEFQKTINTDNDSFLKKLSALDSKLKLVSRGFKNMLPAMLAMIGPVVIQGINYLISAISALGAGIVEIIAPLGVASGIIAGLPSLLFAAAAAFVAVKVGISGMGDALKAVLSAQEQQQESELEQLIMARKHTDALSAQAQAHMKVRLAMLQLAPAAREFVNAIKEIKPAFDDFKKAIQQALFENLNKGLDDAKKLLPGLQDGFVGVAGAVGKLGADFLKMISSSEWMKDLNFMLDQSKGLIGDFGKVLMDVANIFRDVAVAAEPVVDWIRQAAVYWADFWAKSVEQARGDGTLTAFFEKAIEAAQSLGHVISGIVEIIYQLGRAAQESGLDMWDRIGDGLHNTADGMASIEGQTAIKDWISTMNPLLHEMWLLVKDIGAAFVEVGNTGVDQWVEVTNKLRTEFLPVLVDIFQQMQGNFLVALVALLTTRAKIARALVGPISGLLVFAKVVLAGLSAVAALLDKVPLLAQALTALFVVKGVIGGFQLLFGLLLHGAIYVADFAASLTALASGQALASISTVARGVATEIASLGTAVKTAVVSMIASVSALPTAMGLAFLAMQRWVVGMVETVVLQMMYMKAAIVAGFSQGFVAGIINIFVMMANGIKTIFTGLMTFLSTNWVALLVGAVVLVVALIIANWDKLKDYFSGLTSWLGGVWDGVKEIFTEVWDSIKDSVLEAAKAIWAAATEMWNAFKPVLTLITPALKILGLLLLGMIVGALIAAAKATEFLFKAIAWLVDKALIGFRMVSNVIIDLINNIIWGINKLITAYNYTLNFGEDAGYVKPLNEITDAQIDATAATIDFGMAQEDAAEETEDMASRVKDAYESVKSVIGGVADYVDITNKTTLKQFGQGLKDMAKALQQELKNEAVITRRISAQAGDDAAKAVLDSMKEELGTDAPALFAKLADTNKKTFQQIVNAWAKSHGILQPFITEMDRAKKAVTELGREAQRMNNSTRGSRSPGANVPGATSAPGAADAAAKPVQEQTKAVEEATVKLQAAVDKVASITASAATSIPANWQAVSNAVAGTLSAMTGQVNTAANAFRTAVAAIKPPVNLAAGFQAAVGQVKAIWTGLVEDTKYKMSQIRNAITAALAQMKQIVTSSNPAATLVKAMTTSVNQVKALWTGLVADTQAKFSQLVAAIQSSMSRLTEIVSNAVRGLPQIFAEAVRGIGQAWSGLVGVIEGPVNKAIEVINTLVAALNNVLSYLDQPLIGGGKTEGKAKGGKVDKKASGGEIVQNGPSGFVPGVGNTDSVPVMLMPGEFVIRKKAVQTLGTDYLHKLNYADRKKPVQKFASGGEVGRAATPQDKVDAAVEQANNGMEGMPKGRWSEAIKAYVLNLIEALGEYVSQFTMSNIIAIAESQIGVPYVWGASNPEGEEGGPGEGFDCSGFTSWVYGKAGMSIPRTANTQYAAARKVPLSAAPVGALIFYNLGRLAAGQADHVGINAGGGMQIDAGSPGVSKRAIFGGVLSAGTFGEMHHGGFVEGEGDRIKILQAGEFVFSKKAVASYGKDALAAANIAALRGGGLARTRMPSVVGANLGGAGSESQTIALALEVDGKTVTKTVQVHGRRAKLKMAGGRD